jgi:hypothetical protein
MLSRSLMGLILIAGSAFLWTSALHELVSQPVTHTGTQPYARPAP